MKKIVLFILMPLLGFSNILHADLTNRVVIYPNTTRLEKDKVTIEHGTFTGYRIFGFGFPRFIKFTNASDKAVVIQQFGNSLVKYHEVIKASKPQFNASLGLMLFGEGVIGAILGTTVDGKWARCFVGGASGLTMYRTYILLRTIRKNAENEWKEKMFSEPITINPGETVLKIFWLKNPTEPVKISLDAIQTTE